MSDAPIIIGLISDTHGLVRAGVHQALAGVSVILHAGDVGGDEILDELQLIAPVVAVHGNCDDPWDPRLVPRIDRPFGGVSVHVSHGHEVGAPTPQKLLESYDADVIVYGHTHRQLVTRVGERLAVNPGAAGPRRFRLGASVGRLTIVSGHVDVEIVELED